MLAIFYWLIVFLIIVGAFGGYVRTDTRNHWWLGNNLLVVIVLIIIGLAVPELAKVWDR